MKKKYLWLVLILVSICLLPSVSYGVSATGGNITTSGGYRIHTFYTNGTFTPDGSMSVEVLVVAGGGAGGAGNVGQVSVGTFGGGEGKRLTDTFGVDVTDVVTDMKSGKRQLRAVNGTNSLLLRGVSDTHSIKALRFMKDSRLSTDSVVVEGVSVDNATIRLAKQGNVDAVVRCDIYDVTGCASGWIETDISFIDYGDFIEFMVEHFTGYGGIATSGNLYVTSNTNTQLPNMSTAQDAGINSYGAALATGTLYKFINASMTTSGFKIQTTDKVNFSSYWSDGSAVDTAYATFKLYYGDSIPTTLICQFGDDSTGGVQIPDNGAGLRTGGCSPASDKIIPNGTKLWYMVNVWAASIGGGTAAAKTATLQWDTATANTWVNYTGTITPDISVTTNQTTYLRGQIVNVSGTFYWSNTTGISSKNVTMNIYNNTGGLKQTRNITTNSNGFYNDTYTLSSTQESGTWSVNVTGVYDVLINATNSTTFIVYNAYPAVNSIVVTPNPAINGTTINITANVTDDTGVNSVSAEIIYPSGTLWQNITLTGSNPYSGTFVSPGSPLGNYTIRIWANDIENTINNTQSVQFIPVVSLTQTAAITIDGGFGDWNTLQNISNNQETLHYTTASGVWSSTGAISPPIQRSSHGMVYDNSIGNVLVFGGTSSAVGICDSNSATDKCNGTYYYNASNRTWVALIPATPPSARSDMGIAFEPSLNMTVIFGGDVSSTATCDGTGTRYCNGTYGYNASGNKWSSLNAISPPLYRGLVSMTYDENLDMILLFGGFSSAACDGTGTAYCDGTYAYNSTNRTWIDLNPTSSPSARYGAGMVFDRTLNMTLLFGGLAGGVCDGTAIQSCNGTYAYNASNNTWVALGPSTPPSPRRMPLMAFDTTINKTVLWGGIVNSGTCDSSSDAYCNITYTYNTAQNKWVALNATNTPLRRYAGGAAFDTKLNRTVIYGGISSVACDNTGTTRCNGTYTMNWTSSTDWDITTVSVASNASHLFAYWNLAGSPSGTKYRVYIATNATGGNSTSATGTGILPLAYDYSLDINTTACTVYNSTRSSAGTCTNATNMTRIEVSVPLSTLNVTAGEVINITFETEDSLYLGTAADYAPDRDSYITFTISGVTVTSLSAVPNPVTVNSFINLSASVTGTGTIDTVLIEVEQPGGARTNYTTRNTGSTYYNDTINVTVIGLHTYRIYANDTINTRNDTESGTFTSNGGGATAYLEITLVAPNASLATNLIQNNTFLVNATVYCREGGCSTVNGTVRYNLTLTDPDTRVNETEGGIPFYITDSPQLASKSCGTMAQDDFCNLTWIVNATGDTGSNWKLGVMFSSTDENVPVNYTDNATVSITDCAVDFTIHWSSLSFGLLVPNTNNNSAPGNDDNIYNTSVNTGSCSTDLYVKGTGLTNTTLNSVIGVGNITWGNSSNSYSSSVNLSGTSVLINASISPVRNVTTWYWLNMPPVFAGRYNGTITITGVKNGQSP